MFTPDHNQAAAELMRVCRSGGRIGLANWTPDGFIGQVFKILAKYVPPPAGVRSPALWGTREHLVRLFEFEPRQIRTEKRSFKFRYRSPEHFVEVFNTYYGPVLKAFAALDEQGRKGLSADFHDLIGRLNAADDGTMVVPSEYLEAVIVKR
jgi:hypothetical protein